MSLSAAQLRIVGARCAFRQSRLGIGLVRLRYAKQWVRDALQSARQLTFGYRPASNIVVGIGEPSGFFQFGRMIFPSCLPFVASFKTSPKPSSQW